MWWWGEISSIYPTVPQGRMSMAKKNGPELSWLYRLPGGKGCNQKIMTRTGFEPAACTTRKDRATTAPQGLYRVEIIFPTERMGSLVRAKQRQVLVG